MSETARQMVCRFGMSEALGPLTYGSPSGPSYLEGPASFVIATSAKKRGSRSTPK
jgi:ATP-dependent Zn protease